MTTPATPPLPSGYTLDAAPSAAPPLPPGYTSDNAAPQSPAPKWPITPLPGESFADTMKRAVEAGKSVTPQEIQSSKEEAIKKVPTVLTAALLAGPLLLLSGTGIPEELTGGGIAGAAGSGATSGAASQIANKGLRAASGENVFTPQSAKDVAESTLAGGTAGAAAGLFGKVASSLFKSKLARGMVNESLGATSRDVTYGNPAKAILDEGINSPITGDIEKYKTALRSGLPADQAMLAAGGRATAVQKIINTLSPELDQQLSAASETRPWPGPSNVKGLLPAPKEALGLPGSEPTGPISSEAQPTWYRDPETGRFGRAYLSAGKGPGQQSGGGPGVMLRTPDYGAAAATQKGAIQIPVADVIDKPLMESASEISSNRAMTQAEKDAALTQLGALQQSLKEGLSDTITPLQANRIKQAIGNRINWAGTIAVTDEVKPAYRAVYAALKNAVNAAVPEAAPLNERLSNLLAAQTDIEKLMKAEEVGQGKGALGSAVTGIARRAEALAGRAIPAASTVSGAAGSYAPAPIGAAAGLFNLRALNNQ